MTCSPNIAATARAAGISRYVLQYRLRRKGMSLAEALLMPARGYRRRGLTALARAAGLRRQTLSYRLKIGLPLAVALAAPVRRASHA